MDRQIEQDPETGKITKSHLSSEEASKMVKNRYQKDINANAASLLGELGWNDENPAPPSAKRFASKIAKADSGMVGAWKELRRLAGLDKDEYGVWDGEGTCPTCGLNKAQQLSARLAGDLLNELRKYMAESEADGLRNAE